MDGREGVRKFDVACLISPASGDNDGAEKSEKKKKSFMDKLKETFEE